LKKEDRTYNMYLDGIQTATQRIGWYVEGYEFKTFKKDNKTFDAVIRNFEIIGETSKKLPDEIKKKYINVPWQEMYYFRNKISHEYFGIDYEIIWDIATNDLPETKLQIDKIVETEK
jgi:uncharacterized protein with HEPN domain